MFSNYSPNSPNLFTHVDAFSEKIGINDETACFRVPGYQGDLLAYQINNNSMSPTLSYGDIVLCRAVEQVEEIIQNKLYAIVTEEKTWIKRLQCCFDEKGNITHLSLSSDNKLMYKTFNVPIHLVKNIFRVTGRLTDDGINTK